MHLYCISSVLPKETTVSTPHCLTCPALPEARPKAQVATQKHDHSIKHASIFDNMYEEETETTPPTIENVKKKKKSKFSSISCVWDLRYVPIELNIILQMCRTANQNHCTSHVPITTYCSAPIWRISCLSVSDRGFQRSRYTPLTISTWISARTHLLQYQYRSHCWSCKIIRSSM